MDLVNEHSQDWTPQRAECHLPMASRTDWPLPASGTRSSRDQPFLEILPDGLASWTWPDVHFISQGQTKLSVQRPPLHHNLTHPHPYPHPYCELEKLRLNFILTVLFCVQVSGVGLWEGRTGVVTDWLFFACFCSEEVLSRVCRAGGQGPRLFKCIGHLRSPGGKTRERERGGTAGIHNRSPADVFERMMSPYMYVCSDIVSQFFYSSLRKRSRKTSV